MTTDATLESPLLGTDSPLDDRQKRVIERVAEAERAEILALPTDDPLDPKRHFRVEATRSEMFKQPEVIAATWARNADALESLSNELADHTFDRVFLVGAGDSFAVMIAARRALELSLAIPCEPMQSLEFAYYEQHLVTPHSLVIALSSSGETTRTVEAVLIAQHARALTVSLTNTADSSLDQESKNTLLLEATRVGWPTQSSTAALALLLRLASLVGLRRGVEGASAFATEVDKIPTLVAEVLEHNDLPIAEVAGIEAHRSIYLFSAGGPNWAAAVVGAAKVKETTPNHALEIQVEEYHHYNSQKPGEPLFIFAPSGPSVPRAVDTARDARRYGGQLYVFTTYGERAFDKYANRVFELPDVSEALSPILYVLAAQLIGYHLGMAKFAAAEAEFHG